ncbi:MAG: sugar phosphate nucleotidyltransferase, partial [Candidatus Kapabacteria bacterium]|nr:sugar phosphate nucleotidyltransferase [Candidatus Kapabacteria bacterium]MDW7997670.1 sugar phosphate nucleotidyltransferase [Bacteroidota bacterium]
MDAVATILAGGVDAYLWPQSREQRPKFFLSLHPNGSMLRNTLQRLQPLFSPQRIAIATTAALSSLLQRHLPDFPPEQLIVEPIARNTAPCLALAALWWEVRCSPETILLLFPADHAIAHLGEFHQSLELAVRVARQTRRPIVIGLAPQRPETRFGYIQVEEHPEARLARQGVLRVRAFAEKPDHETAQRFLESGDFLWNSGILILPHATVWDLLQRYLPEYHALFAPLRARAPQGLATADIERIYRQLRPLSLERGLLEAAAPEMLALRCSFDWSDVGTWDEVYRRSLKDPRGNVLQGDVIAIDIGNCYVSALGGRPLALVGVSDLIVVDAEQALLICPRGSSERVAE